MGTARPSPTRPISYPKFPFAAWKTLTNSARYVWSRRRRLLLEGGFSDGTYRNWSGDRRHTAHFEQPANVEELRRIVRRASSIRVVGAGHSFNDALMTDGITLSLDQLAGVVSIDADAKTVTAWGGTRLRDLTAALLVEGLAFEALASHDAQSIAGILATDVHGTGREPSHLSDAVVALDLVDGNGELHQDLRPGDTYFKAAVGGIGSVGVITKVTLRVRDAFNLRQGSSVETLQWAQDNLDRLFSEHQHVSLYAYPFTRLLHVHTWTQTHEPRSTFGDVRESINEAKAAIVAATFGDATAHWGLLPRTATAALRLQRATRLVLHSHEAFSRSQYHLHQELEIAVPRHRVWPDLRTLFDLYEQRYQQQRLPFLLVEIRFTPADHKTSYLGAGAGRDTAWLCLCCNQSGAVGEYFADVEEWVRKSDARIHLGKWCETLDSSDLANMHNLRFAQFQIARRRLDPAGRFANAFTERVLGPVAENRE